MCARFQNLNLSDEKKKMQKLFNYHGLRSKNTIINKNNDLLLTNNYSQQSQCNYFRSVGKINDFFGHKKTKLTQVKTIFSIYIYE